VRRHRRLRKRALGAALILSAGVLAPSPVRGQSLEPRAYANAPVGLNFLIGAYGYSFGGVTVDSAIPVEDFEITSHVAALGYVRALNILGRSGSLGVVVPYAWVSAQATVVGQERDRDVSGPGDPIFRFVVNLYGAPALSLSEFANYRQDTIIGVSLQASAPLGQYDDDKLVNVGTNRWSIKPELGISKALGPATLELASGVTFFTDNDDFLGGHTREQEPLYSVQGHLIYNFPRGIWAALNATYYMGGRTTVDGEENDDRQSAARVGLTLALPVDRYNSVKLTASTGTFARVGSSFTTFGVAWQVRWGAGY
jgi:hypothetical protein